MRRSDHRYPVSYSVEYIAHLARAGPACISPVILEWLKKRFDDCSIRNMFRKKYQRNCASTFVLPKHGKYCSSRPDPQANLVDSDLSYCVGRTVTGYPIVEGRYIDLAAGEVKSVQRGEQTTNGPPTIGVYWHNISVGDCTLYRGMRGGFVDGGVGEFVTRLGKFLENGFCELASLNVSTYSVTVIIETQKSRDEIMRKQYDCGLIASPPSPRPPCGEYFDSKHAECWLLLIKI